MQTIASAIIVLWGWLRFAVAFVAGGLSALAFAPFDVFPILWLTVPVFIWLIDGAEAAENASWWRRLLPAAERFREHVIGQAAAGRVPPVSR